MRLSDLRQPVEAHIPHIPFPVADFAIRAMVRDFCRRTFAWTRTREVEFSHACHIQPLALAPNEHLERIEAVFVNNKPLELTSERRSDPLEGEVGLPEVAYQHDHFSMAVRPMPPVETLAKVTFALAPSPVGGDMEVEVVDRYFETVLHGILGRLFAEPGRPWTDPDRGMYYLNQYEVGLHEAHKRVDNEHSKIEYVMSYGGL